MDRKKFFDEYAKFIKLALAFSEKSRREGLLALENEVEDIDDEFFKKGIRLVIDGTDPGLIDEILSNRLAHEKNEYMRLLKTVQKRALLGIQMGYNTHILFEVLYSYADLSPEEEKEVEKIFYYDPPCEDDSDEDENSEDEQPDNNADIIVEVTINEFDCLAKLHSRFMQTILRNVDSNDLAIALKKSGQSVRKAFFGNMSKRASVMFKKNMDYMGPIRESDADAARQKIMDIVRHLAETGEIIANIPARVNYGE